MTIERKYVLTKISAGDYLLPSNDGATLFRIRQYEDGPSYGLDDWPNDRLLWALGCWDRPIGADPIVDVAAWDRWDLLADGFATRKEAIDFALNIDTPKEQ